MSDSEPTNPQIIAATTAFLAAMRREFLRRHPNTPMEEVRVPIWESMTPEDKGVVVRAIRAAILASSVAVNR